MHSGRLSRRTCILRAKLGVMLLTLSWLHAVDTKSIDARALPDIPGKGHAGPAGRGPAYSWIAPAVGSFNSLGSIVVERPSLRRAVSLLRPSIEGNRGSLVCQATHWNPAANQLVITYGMGTAVIQVTLTIEVTAASLQATLDADQPVIKSVDMGSWDPELQAKPLAMPYYTGNVWYLTGIMTYVNAWWDWHATHASRLHGTAAQYLPQSDTTLLPLHEQLTLIFSPDLDATLPDAAKPAYPKRAEFRRRLELDILDRDLKRFLLNFGAVQTDGMISIHQDSGHWILRPYSRTRNFSVPLKHSSHFAVLVSVHSDGGSADASAGCPGRLLEGSSYRIKVLHVAKRSPRSVVTA